MWRDEIVESVRKVRQEHAAKFNYDIGAIVADARKRQEESGRKVVSFSPQRQESSEEPAQ